MRYRNLLLVLALVFAQLASSAHAVEHFQDADRPLEHACSLCLAAHDVGSALPATPPTLALADPTAAAPATVTTTLTPLRPFRATARAPPAA